MMQCGLFVTARSYQANVTRGTFTHFIREEDRDMTSGRLDDELKRMSVIADRIGPHCLMLFNESFADTNEREGSEIGYQVVRALLDARNYKLAAKEPLPTSYGEDLYYRLGGWLEDQAATPAAG
jgi:DNA mismatch repair ATPase MutS